MLQFDSFPTYDYILQGGGEGSPENKKFIRHAFTREEDDMTPT